jgi:hypothetical protein
MIASTAVELNKPLKKNTRRLLETSAAVVKFIYYTQVKIFPIINAPEGSSSCRQILSLDFLQNPINPVQILKPKFSLLDTLGDVTLHVRWDCSKK